MDRFERLQQLLDAGTDLCDIEATLDIEYPLDSQADDLGLPEQLMAPAA